MKKISKIIVLFLLTLLVSCKQEVEKPKVIYENSAKSKEQPKADTTQLEIADLPVQMQGTNYLIHPIGKISSGKLEEIKYESSTNVNADSFKISNHSENEITGYLRNLKFQEISSDSIKTLTNKAILIQTATYINAVSDKAKQQVLIYTLADADTNMDGKLDANDIKSLYISEISGKRFTKISDDLQELIDWNLTESKNRVYFRTIEDTNKNGQFDKNDILHYHYLDLSNKDWKVFDYNPI